LHIIIIIISKPTRRHPGKILRRSSQGNSFVGEGLNTTGVAEYSDFLPIESYISAISRQQCKIGGKLVLITNRKSYVSFRLVPNSVTLNDLERRNNPQVCVISPNLVAFVGLDVND